MSGLPEPPEKGQDPASVGNLRRQGRDGVAGAEFKASTKSLFFTPRSSTPEELTARKDAGLRRDVIHSMNISLD
ncbi:hypothetical protein [Bradyrhizobium sp. LHD-71]|uniref:hypothetical protein n=1 Tax=Bradyrhizobium sp. LHD-71 TaxID=3072141 RepID=UPI00280F10E9|nr:hypothetical protein [Bradyrhizobium sp. LHD-71]MDQ8732791.1 hypothetical protein [Bradyrhizobium sp. LHD-71]